jgi:hypothetical protein
LTFFAFSSGTVSFFLLLFISYPSTITSRLTREKGTHWVAVFKGASIEAILRRMISQNMIIF